MRWFVCDTLYNAEAYDFGHLDSYAHYLEAMGEGVDRHDWAGHLGFIKSLMPLDVVFALDNYAEALKIPARKHVAQVACATEVPPGFDLVISSIPALVSKYTALGYNAKFQHLCFDARARVCGMGVERDLGCVFIGTTGPNHKKRTRLLSELSDVVTVLPPVFGREYFRTIARAKAVFNVHAEWAEGAVNNMRCWETVGLGAALVSDGDGSVSGTPWGWYFKDADEARLDIAEALKDSERLYVYNATADALLSDTYESRVPTLIDWVRSL